MAPILGSQGVCAFAAATIVISIGCSTASPTDITADVSGTWIARIAGTQQRTGSPQTDEATLYLQQRGTEVTGSMQYAGVDGAAVLSGTVENSTFSFTAVQSLSATCTALIDVRATVSTTRREMRGSYRAVTCEDTVIGTILADGR